MSTTFHELRITPDDLYEVHHRGQLRHTFTEQGQAVILYRAGDAQPIAADDARAIPLGDFMAQELTIAGVSAWTPVGVDAHDSYRIVVKDGAGA
ncbi:hypothetical protein [Actinoplanes sp. NPDC051494]|uniref:hypothetical protein n=1 Tax=Actinoplanes sp. NPDC051494 TaxID=3363907 RepID=UPI0037A9E71D